MADFRSNPTYQRLQDTGTRLVQGVGRVFAQQANAPFLRATMAAIWLAILADGVEQDEEVEIAQDFIIAHPLLAAFQPKQKTELFEEYRGKAKSKATQIELLGYIAEVQKNKEAVAVVQALVEAIIEADNDVSDVERKVQGRINRALGL